MLDKNNVILIVTDIQGNLAQLMHEREALFKNVGILIEGIKALDIPILWIEQYPRGLGPTVPEVASHLDGYEPLPKKTFSSIRNQAIKERFESFKRNQVLLTGIETHVCIYQSAMDLLARGIETHVVSDAVSSRTALNKQIGLDKIARAGGHITTVETALFELLKVAEGDTFKKIIKLVK
ncbi:MAG: hydrolase [Candidatus Latescibacteria bacterium]|nr:hydrolase [Candidatus Latescibacterota bacterium]